MRLKITKIRKEKIPGYFSLRVAVVLFLLLTMVLYNFYG